MAASNGYSINIYVAEAFFRFKSELLRVYAAVMMVHPFPVNRSKAERLVQEATDTCATHTGPVWDVKDKDHQKQKMTMIMALSPQLSRNNFYKT